MRMITLNKDINENNNRINSILRACVDFIKGLHILIKSAVPSRLFVCRNTLYNFTKNACLQFLLAN